MKNLLREARKAFGWSQKQLARRLGISQAYVAMLESEARRLTPSLASKLVRLGASPVVAPAKPPETASLDAQGLATQFGALGYPGFAYLGKRARRRNPAEVLLAALAQNELEARLVEALPWLLMRYSHMDFRWLVREAKLRDLQNRLGFIATLARQKVEQTQAADSPQAHMLRRLEKLLEPSLLVREHTLGRKPSSEFGLQWLRDNRSEAARQWNLLTTWRAEDLRYAV
jgi:transcriptional regulator with XRE-family HTH domain